MDDETPVGPWIIAAIIGAGGAALLAAEAWYAVGMGSPPPDTVDILGQTSPMFIDTARSRDVGRDHAMAIYRDFYRVGHADIGWLRPAGPVHASEREGTTTKFTQRIDDRLETESVILPQTSRTGRSRTTLCVSSQVGCAMGCTFCETAQMGLLRNLTPGQIVSQWHAARHELGTPIDNIVFMGMGEPMDNLDAVLAAIEVLVDSNGPALAAARIGVSTVGHANGIRRLAEFARRPGFRQLRLAVSVNAPNDEIRGAIMPINRVTPLAELKHAMAAWPASAPRPLFIEYVLIPGVNDESEHARALCRYLDGLHANINVIPYNPRRDSPWPAPDEATIDRFVEAIRVMGRFVSRRRTMGRTAMAACGQLGNPDIRRRRLTTVSRSTSE